MNTYKKVRFSGDSHVIEFLTSQFQEMVISSGLEIREAKVEELGDKFVYDGLLFVPHGLGLLVNKGELIEEFREVNYGYLNFSTSMLWGNNEQTRFRAYANAIERPNEVNLDMDHFSKGGFRSRLPFEDFTVGTVTGDLSGVLYVRDALRAHPIKGRLDFNFHYSDKLVIDKREL